MIPASVRIKECSKCYSIMVSAVANVQPNFARISDHIASYTSYNNPVVIMIFSGIYIHGFVDQAIISKKSYLTLDVCASQYH